MILRKLSHIKNLLKYLDIFFDRLEKSIEKNFFKKYDSLNKSRRFVITWTLLLIILIFTVFIQNFMLNDYYQVNKFIPGGVLSEGIVGTFNNVNPIYAASDVDSAISKLLFASLFSYNSKNQLVGDLAKSYSIDSVGTTYTVNLRPNIYWQDGQPITAQDVVYTYDLIENPDTQSPLQSSFQGISVTAKNNTTVVFKLPDVLASFIYSLTNGIVPQHILSSIPAVDMRSSLFNTLKPIGSGPFIWNGIQVAGNNPANAKTQVNLLPNSKYFAGKPLLTQLIIKTYPTQSLLREAYNNNSVYMAVGLSHDNKYATNSYNFIFTAGTYVFLKTSSVILSDLQIRKALVNATNLDQIIAKLNFPTHKVTEPLLVNQLAYNPSYRQANYNLSSANSILQSDGWIMSKNGYRYKNNTMLKFSLVTLNTRQYGMVADLLKSQWKKIGVNLNVILQNQSDFNLSLEYHQYDALLNSISIGIDPDVFVYWDSSQVNPQLLGSLNYSEFKNTTADISLESGRTRLDTALRVIKYKSFLATWQSQSPAIGLYQPRLLIIAHGPIYGLSAHFINTNTDVYSNIQKWEINTKRQTE